MKKMIKKFVGAEYGDWAYIAYAGVAMAAGLLLNIMLH